jgi:transitional endoplasmic reticulum ATPase
MNDKPGLSEGSIKAINNNLNKNRRISSERVKPDDILGLDTIRASITDRIDNILINSKEIKSMGGTCGGGSVLYGLPGTGKSMLSQAITDDLVDKHPQVVTSYILRTSDLASHSVGKSSALISEIFEGFRQDPAFKIVIFDEVDGIIPLKTTHSVLAKERLTALLTEMQATTNIYYLSTTNRPFDIDEAFERLGRLGTFEYIPLPDEPTRIVLAEKYLGKLPFDKPINWTLYAQQHTEGYTGCDFSELKSKLIDKYYKNGRHLSLIDLTTTKILKRNFSDLKIKIDEFRNLYK